MQTGCRLFPTLVKLVFAATLFIKFVYTLCKGIFEGNLHVFGNEWYGFQYMKYMQIKQSL